MFVAVTATGVQPAVGLSVNVGTRGGSMQMVTGNVELSPQLFFTLNVIV